MSIEFLITSLIVVASPGTGVLYTLAAGLSRGSRASAVAAFADGRVREQNVRLQTALNNMAHGLCMFDTAG